MFMMRERSVTGLMVAATAVALTLASVGQAAAEAIVYSVQAVATGILGSTPFSNQLVTINVAADTSRVTELAPGLYTNTGIGSVSVDNGPSVTFTDSLSAFVNGPDALGIADVPASRDVLDAIVPNGTYSLTADIGPVSGQANFNAFFQFATGSGIFELSDVESSATFTAAVNDVPEPASAWLIAAGLAALPGLCRFRRAR